MRISTVIISKNESEKIGKCIESVLDFSDEIIVVDDFSEDNTVEIANSFPKVKCFQNKFEGFSEQKNFGNNLASGEFIFSIDCDEWCTKGLIDYLIESKNNLPDLLEIRRINIYFGNEIRYGLRGVEKKIRLWKKGLAHWGGSAVHEHLIFDPNHEVIGVEKYLMHNTSDSRKQLLKKTLKYTKIAAKDYSKKSYPYLATKMIVSPIPKVVKDLFIKGGILNGVDGLFFASIAFTETIFKYFWAIILKSKES